ncbi:MAG: type II toxin-antitoxin system RelE/ParE family toxin [Nitrosospira multiformis]|nr:type II toxin-antitoxin system RelE/ParE family toxin [Nitrosospira multiformis]
MNIRYLPGALGDLNEALTYYYERSPNVAQRFANAVRAEERTIRDFPEIAYSLGSNLRILRVTKFPYSLVYRPIEDDILIIAVAHHKRRPGYWKSRVHNANFAN